MRGKFFLVVAACGLVVLGLATPAVAKKPPPLTQSLADTLTAPIGTALQGLAPVGEPDVQGIVQPPDGPFGVQVAWDYQSADFTQNAKIILIDHKKAAKAKKFVKRATTDPDGFLQYSKVSGVGQVAFGGADPGLPGYFGLLASIGRFSVRVEGQGINQEQAVAVAEAITPFLSGK